LSNSKKRWFREISDQTYEKDFQILQFSKDLEILEHVVPFAMMSLIFFRRLRH